MFIRMIALIIFVSSSIAISAEEVTFAGLKDGMSMAQVKKLCHKN